MRVLHGPVNVGNQPWVISREERKLGVQSDLVVHYPPAFSFPADQALAEAGNRSLSAMLRRAWFAMTAPVSYDVLHYYMGQSFMTWEDLSGPKWFWHADLLWAKKVFRRKIFLTMQGCDVRLSDLSEANNEFTPCKPGHCGNRDRCRSGLDDRRRRLIDRIVPLADRVLVLNPELVRFVPGSQFMPYGNVDVEAFEPIAPKTTGRAVLLHAPSDGSIKGTPMIDEAIARLKDRWDIEYVVVRNMPHHEAMLAYRRADLIIDQVLAGWYGGLAVEGMAMGKPVACYVRDADLDVIPEQMRRELPLVRLNPASLEASFDAALRRRHEWAEWGRRSRQFVLRWHHPRALAAALIEAYTLPHSQFILRPATMADSAAA